MFFFMFISNIHIHRPTNDTMICVSYNVHVHVVQRSHDGADVWGIDDGSSNYVLYLWESDTKVIIA